MKKIFLTFLSFTFCTLLVAQQNNIGINYQAVARDLDGQIIANKSLSIKIALLGNFEVQ